MFFRTYMERKIKRLTGSYLCWMEGDRAGLAWALSILIILQYLEKKEIVERKLPLEFSLPEESKISDEFMVRLLILIFVKK